MHELQIIVLSIIAILNAFLSLVIVVGQKNIVGRIYSVFAVLLSFWALGLAGFIYTQTPDLALFFANSYYIIGTAFVCLFLLFSRIFPNKIRLTADDYALILLPVVLISLFFIFNKNLFLLEIIQNENGKDVILDKNNYFFFIIFLSIYLGSAFRNLTEGYKSSYSVVEKTQFAFIIFGTSIAWLFGVVFNIVLPWFGNYRYIWLGPIFTIFMIVSIGYAIAKHHLFNAKVIATEIITFLLWIGILIRTLTSNNAQDWIINSVILALTSIFGILLVRSVLREVESRERIEHLAEELAKANAQLQELSRQKTEFLSMASHQFRSPLTAIKGYSSMLLEGSFGKMSKKVGDAVDKIFQSSQLLVSVIDDFLNISRIELGKLKFRFEVTDLRKLVVDILESERPTIEKTGLAFKLAVADGQDYTATVDSEKIRQVILNILDNALKYTPTGSVSVSLHRRGKNIEFAVADTGAGISPENILRLFEKFNRADAAKVKTNGTGLGLYIAKNIIDAHGGRIRAESEGIGKGSTFRIELLAGKQEELLKQNAT